MSYLEIAARVATPDMEVGHASIAAYYDPVVVGLVSFFGPAKALVPRVPRARQVDDLVQEAPVRHRVLEADVEASDESEMLKSLLNVYLHIPSEVCLRDECSDRQMQTVIEDQLITPATITDMWASINKRPGSAQGILRSGTAHTAGDGSKASSRMLLRSPRESNEMATVKRMSKGMIKLQLQGLKLEEPNVECLLTPASNESSARRRYYIPLTPDPAFRSWTIRVNVVDQAPQRVAKGVALTLYPAEASPKTVPKMIGDYSVQPPCDQVPGHRFLLSGEPPYHISFSYFLKHFIDTNEDRHSSDAIELVNFELNARFIEAGQQYPSHNQFNPHFPRLGPGKTLGKEFRIER
ncbi:hypothetical protein DFP72DRAFT_842057 [Ephemerocybe angulata]|uniref:Uncharacterized protein n=1 Tax=Ephemerocybe angulata TaxID=980116 RepID=A0A8H6IDT1_9AGAR|nr:hypothetical protein DFP72DRAFT_842057 [Tulosesus angulatus]